MSISKVSRNRIVWTALAAAVLVVAAGCGGSSGGSGAKKISLVAYSTPKEAYAALIPAFQATKDGKGITFTQSFGASGDQSRAVVAGLGADVVEFALDPDMTRLVDKGLVDKAWDSGPTRGIVTDSIVAFVVRKGNPKGIKTWADLIKPGVKIVNANPFISGGARWNVLAAYGAAIKQGKSPADAQAYLASLFKNITVQPSSARDALNAFVGGQGDVLLSYENEAIAAQQAGQPVDYVVPDQTILIENPIAAVKDARAGDHAKDFVTFLFTPAAQRIFGQKGYRPVDKTVAAEFEFPTPSGLFTIADLGGWPKVMTDFFDANNGIVAKIEKGLGVATSA